MKKFNVFLQSFLVQQDAIALPRLILLISPMVILLLAVLGLALQVNRQLADQQQVSLNRIAHVAVRNVAQIQREHLRLKAQIMQDVDQLDQQSLTMQRDLVWSRLRILENPRHSGEASATVKALLQAYRVQWEQIQPLLDLWMTDPSAAPIRNTLIEEIDQSEKILNDLVSASQHSFEDRISAWAESSKRLNGLLTGASVIVLLMILLMTYVIYQFFRVQARIEQGLRNSEQRLRAILDTLPDAVFRLTHNGVYIDAKPAKELGISIEPDALTGKHITQILPADIATPILAAMADAFVTGQEQLCEGEMMDTTTGIMRNVEARILPSGSGEVQIIVRDITTDKQQEEATLQAQKLESLGILAGGIAHDFNNLLTGMLAQASLAKMKLAKGIPAVDSIDKAIVSAERAADLTRQLLAYAGKGKFQIVSLDINQLVRDTTGLMQTALPSQATLQLDLGQLPLIKADRGQIQQVVMNLFINAIEALGEEGGAIQIATHFQALSAVDTLQGYIIGNLEPGPYVVLQIADSGKGMDQSILSRIFDPFFSTKPKGHGLGLSATMGIIRAHGGGLQVQSQPERGTTFTILLPALDNAEVDPQPAPIAPAAAKPEKRQTVLVIDDEEAIREVAADILTDHGFHVMTASSGSEGIEQFRQLQKQVGVVLLDMKMPGMNGKQTYQVLRQIEPNVKVIFMSGYSETEVSTQVGSGQPLPFLSKPYSADLLTHYVRQMLLAA
ncbi:MAG: response regulator [Caldilineaceae bacterium]